MTKSESKYFNTAKKMKLALVDLMKQKPFEYITIRELCEKAGVNRSTFYLHYDNTHDLLVDTTRYILDEFLSYFPKDIQSIANAFSDSELDELIFINRRYLIPYLTYIRENKEVFSTAVQHMQSFCLERVYKQMFETIFNPILDRFHYPQEDRAYVMMYYLNGISAISHEWIKEGCEKPIEDVARIITACVFGLDRRT